MRGPGRPPLDEADESVPVNVRMPSRQYEEVCARAHKERVTPSEIIRRDIKAAELRKQK